MSSRPQRICAQTISVFVPTMGPPPALSSYALPYVASPAAGPLSCSQQQVLSSQQFTGSSSLRFQLKHHLLTVAFADLPSTSGPLSPLTNPVVLHHTALLSSLHSIFPLSEIILFINWKEKTMPTFLNQHLK